MSTSINAEEIKSDSPTLLHCYTILPYLDLTGKSHRMKPRSHRRLSSPENPVNFLKINLSDDRSTGIRIPKKFTEKHGKELVESEKVILKVANGDVWQVDLQQKSRDEIWLKDGWWEFADWYGIEFGHLMMFRYEGFSLFSVNIFDASGSEILYSNEKKKKDDDDDDRQVKPKVKSELEKVKSEDLDSFDGECSRKRKKK